MTTKKKVDFLKTKEIFKKYPIILFFQHNNLTVTDWVKLRTHITQINDTKIFITKNSIVEKILLDNQNTNLSIEHLFQGPNFIIGCHTLDQLDSICNLINSVSNVIFIGGLIENRVINHLDLKKLLELNNSGVSTNTLLQQLFFNTLNINSSMLKVLNTDFISNTFSISQIELINCLNQIQFAFSKDKHNNRI